MKVERLSDGSVIKRLERAGRKCGDCRLCCKLLAVGKDGRDDFKKPQGEWCTHCFDGGCRIYATRPPDCEEYECTWFAGVFEDDDRPDKSKVVVSLEHGDSVRGPDGREVAGPTPVWCVYESIPGVTLKGRAKAIVDELSTLVIEETPGEFAVMLEAGVSVELVGVSGYVSDRNGWWAHPDAGRATRGGQVRVGKASLRYLPYA